MSSPPSPPPRDDATVDLVRRRLLVAGGRYVAPTVLVTLFLSERAYGANSCNPGRCGPANPFCPPTQNCTPYGGSG